MSSALCRLSASGSHPLRFSICRMKSQLVTLGIFPMWSSLPGDLCYCCLLPAGKKLGSHFAERKTILYNCGFQNLLKKECENRSTLVKSQGTLVRRRRNLRVLSLKGFSCHLPEATVANLVAFKGDQTPPPMNGENEEEGAYPGVQENSEFLEI